MKKFTALFLCTLLSALLVLPCSKVYAASGKLSVPLLKEKYPDGAYWNHQVVTDHTKGQCPGSCNAPDYYTDQPCTDHSGNAVAGEYDCNVFNGGLQCCGFARKLAYDAYGTYSTRWPYYGGEEAMEYLFTALKPGDVLHYYGNGTDPTYGHWVFVIGVSGRQVTVGECNVGGNCMIRWDRVLDKSKMESCEIYSAPYALNDASAGTSDPLSWADPAVNPSKHDCAFSVRVSSAFSGTFGPWRITIWDPDGKEIASYTEKASGSDQVKLYCEVSTNTGAVLETGTTYTYQYEILFNGKTRKSPVLRFTTKGCAVHDFAVSEVIPPSCTQGGYTSYLCSVCQEPKTDDFTDPFCPASQFTDGPAVEHWAHTGIDFAVSRGLFNGVTDTTFEPGSTMTRGMLVTVLWRYAGTPAEGSNIFSDVPVGSWFEASIAWASENGVVNGVGDGLFNPDGSITREQIATILMRYTDALGIDTGARASLEDFPDQDAVADYARDALQWAVAENLINGSDGQLLPQGNATREQVATILMRYIQNIAE